MPTIDSTPQSHPSAGPGRKIPRRALAATALASALALGAVMQSADALPGADDADGSGTGTNILLIGTDSRDTITAQQKKEFRLGGVGCDCSDTMMLLHVAQDRERVSVVSIPRDSLAELPAHTDRRTGEEHGAHLAKINAAHSEGGGDLAVRTVEAKTGLDIDRYLAVDFARFMKTVDELGKVEVCTPSPLQDPSTGLDLTAGTHHLGGGDSLRYVRSRKVDNSADFGRMQRQQKFLVSFVKKIRSDGALQSPARLKELAGLLLPADRAEKALTPMELVSLAGDLRDIGLSSLEFASVPISDFNSTIEGVGSTLAWDGTRAAVVFDTLGRDRPLTEATAALPSRPADGTARQGEFVPVGGSALECR
ncbi:LCP family protein [Streptomyces sp. NBC_00234]|uniref:LCP family protein n=1 Tax=Streptomyces sp. NBC_00234 TaxID=2903638 RepID=UPI002E27B9A8|nr:LCP family protein [Streptomyces sp. NBC_00234]